MNCVDIKYTPSKMCTYNDELWVGGYDDGVFLYNLELEPIKHIKHPQFKQVTSVLRTPSDMIVCDSDTGVHHCNYQGDYTNFICSGHFSDACLSNDNKIYALNYKQGEIHTFVRNQNSWVKDSQFKLVQYSGGYIYDKLCTTSTHLYVNNAHCVLVYTMSGDYVDKTGGHGRKVGKFDGPYLGDVDSGGRLLVCDWGNHRLQVLDTQKGVWSELCGLDGVEYPGSAGVGEKHLWVGHGNFTQRQLLKLEVI